MRAFMTTGTAHFLKNITDSHPTIDFYFMRSGASTLVYYENMKKKGIFVSGRAFDVLDSYQPMNKKGFIVMENIPVVEDGMDIFEERIKNQFPHIKKVQGIIAARLLKQVKGNTYVFLTQWETERAFIDFQHSKMFEKFNFTKMTRLPAYFAERPFTSTYYLLKEDE